MCSSVNKFSFSVRASASGFYFEGCAVASPYNIPYRPGWRITLGRQDKVFRDEVKEVTVVVEVDDKATHLNAARRDSSFGRDLSKRRRRVFMRCARVTIEPRPPLRAMAFTREEIEHAYNTTRRLRARLSALARLATVHHRGLARPACIAEEAIVTLEASACVIQRVCGGGKFETLALCKTGDFNERWLEHDLAQLSAEVAAARDVLVIVNLAHHTSHAASLRSFGLHSYLGIPLYDDAGQMLGVAAVLGDDTREFNEEDEWWLRTASQPVADALALAGLQARLSEFEQVSTPKGEQSPTEADSRKPENYKPTVLVVDDDRQFNDVICEFLTLEGYVVEAAFDGLEALRLFRPSEHAVVITDVAMPLVNGWELIAALRQHAPELPVVLITGYGSGNWNETYLRKQGINALLSKPLDIDQLLTILRNIPAARSPAQV